MLSLLSPCKLNLFLYVLGKRADGFHDLQSLFCLLNFGDTMTFDNFNAQGQGQIQLLNDMGFKVEDNLIYKAARLLQEHTHCPFDVTIDIQKRIPMGGGLGGGSSNAATTLLALNHLGGFNLSLSSLAKLSEQLGSDVPFFVMGHNAFVEGRGEFIQEQEIDKMHFVVVTPPCHVSTKDVFTDPLLKEHYSKKRTLDELMHTPFANDCVEVVRKKFCDVGHTLDRLVKYGHARMSGTGASCFVSFPSFKEAEVCAQELTQIEPTWHIFVASSLSRSPVHNQLNLL